MTDRPTTYADETTTGRHSIALRGLGRVTLAARVEDPAGFRWVAQLRRDHFPHVAELKSQDVLPVMYSSPRVRDLVHGHVADGTIAIVDVVTYTQVLVQETLDRFGVRLPGGSDPLDALRGGAVSDEIAGAILLHAREYAVATSTVPRIEALLRLAVERAGVPHGTGIEVFDRQALREMGAGQFNQLIARFSLAFADALRPERQADAIVSALEDARYLAPQRRAFLALEDVMRVNRVYDFGPHPSFEMLRQAHELVDAHLRASEYAHFMSTMRPGTLSQDDSAKVLGLQAADITAGIAAAAFEAHHGETLAGAQAVRRIFSRVLVNDKWV